MLVARLDFVIVAEPLPDLLLHPLRRSVRFETDGYRRSLSRIVEQFLCEVERDDHVFPVHFGFQREYARRENILFFVETVRQQRRNPPAPGDVHRDRAVQVDPDAQRVGHALSDVGFREISELQLEYAFGSQAVQRHHLPVERIDPAHRAESLPVAVLEDRIVFERIRRVPHSVDCQKAFARQRVDREYLAPYRRDPDIRVERPVHAFDQPLETVEYRQQNHHRHHRDRHGKGAHSRDDVDHRVRFLRKKVMPCEKER